MRGASHWMQGLAGQGAAARVELSGSDIEPAQLTNIFKPLYTTKPRGMSLGLPPVRRIVDRLGGRSGLDKILGASPAIDAPRRRIALPIEAELSTQVKLLKLREDKHFRHLGGVRNAMEQALMLAPTAVIGRRELAFLAGGEPPTVDAPLDDLNLQRAERRLIEQALQRAGDKVTQAARLLGVSRDTLRYRLERLQLRSGDHAS